jgi:predicted nucleotidyltransferase
MDARPALFTLARVLHEHGLEAVLIGNAAASLQGAPITTVDFDFLFRKMPKNLRKLKAVARSLEATLLRSYYPASGLFRLMRDEDLLQVDFLGRIDGIRSLEGLRRRASRVDLDGYELLVASLEDIIQSKQAAGRPRDRAVLEILKRPCMRPRKRPLTKHEALQRESERALLEQIRRHLALPMKKRTHFLRKRIGLTASCL